MKTANRTILRDQLPLKMPYLIQVFPCYACNFKCQYCIHALPRENHGYISDCTLLDIKLFKDMVDDISASGETVKMLRFAGIGEPLLHPQIAEMVAYASEKKIAKTIDIVTNGALLSPKLSEQLIKAGLSTLRISIEGLSSEEYRKTTGADVDFAAIVENIRFYYEHCGDSRIYVKIIDYMLQGSSEREKFFHEMFDSISHTVAIEHLTPTIQEIDYNEFCGDVDFTLTQDGEVKQNIRVCPQAFYMLQLNPDGTFVPCCSMKYPMVVRPNTTKISHVWNTSELTDFRLALLKGKLNETCKECTLYQYGTYPEDVLDGHEDDLIRRFEGIAMKSGKSNS